MTEGQVRALAALYGGELLADPLALLECQATLAEAHREVARLRNALGAARAEVLAIGATPTAVGARIVRLADVALGDRGRDADR